ncbi:MAG: hypothetical protein ABSH41_31885 [Syntrophobacteraceae bacterium]
MRQSGSDKIRRYNAYILDGVVIVGGGIRIACVKFRKLLKLKRAGQSFHHRLVMDRSWRDAQVLQQ